MSIWIIDQMLAKKQFMKEGLQLLGVTALFTASKYCEIYPPMLDDFVWITANTYTRK